MALHHPQMLHATDAVRLSPFRQSHRK